MKYHSVPNLNHSLPLFYGNTVHLRKKKNFRYIKIGKQKREVQVDLHIKYKIAKTYPFLLKLIKFHVKPGTQVSNHLS